MAKCTIDATQNTKEMVIYSRYLQSINAFVKTPLEDDEVGEKTTATKSVPGHQRRRGPSDSTPVNVSQSNVKYLIDPSLKSGNALPGRSIILQTTPNADVDMTRRFTLVGNMVDFVQYFDGKMKYETYVYNSEGGRHTLGPDLGGD